MTVSGGGVRPEGAHCLGRWWLVVSKPWSADHFDSLSARPIPAGWGFWWRGPQERRAASTCSRYPVRRPDSTRLCGVDWRRSELIPAGDLSRGRQRRPGGRCSTARSMTVPFEVRLVWGRYHRNRIVGSGHHLLRGTLHFRLLNVQPQRRRCTSTECVRNSVGSLDLGRPVELADTHYP